MTFSTIPRKIRANFYPPIRRPIGSANGHLPHPSIGCYFIPSTVATVVGRKSGKRKGTTTNKMMISFHYCSIPPPQKITAAIRGRPSTSGRHIEAHSNMIRPSKTCGRRAFFSSLMFTAASSVPHGRDAFLQEYLERSRENKAKHDKERLDDYYKRNYKDYFELVEGSSQGKTEDLLSETDKEIREWLRRNQN